MYNDEVVFYKSKPSKLGLKTEVKQEGKRGLLSSLSCRPVHPKCSPCHMIRAKTSIYLAQITIKSIRNPECLVHSCDMSVPGVLVSSVVKEAVLDHVEDAFPSSQI